MFRWLKKWFGGSARDTPDSGEVGAHPDGDEAPRYHHDKRALKDWYTSHWDLDYMSREDMEELARKHRNKNASDQSD